jgi:hypothetical protein
VVEEKPFALPIEAASTPPSRATLSANGYPPGFARTHASKPLVEVGGSCEVRIKLPAERDQDSCLIAFP